MGGNMPNNEISLVVNPISNIQLSRSAKDHLRKWITQSFSDCKSPLVFGSLVFPGLYHKENITRAAHHFLRQVLQRCSRKPSSSPDLRRAFFRERKDGEGYHLHFIMEVPPDMSVDQFIALCEQRWITIAIRNPRPQKRKPLVLIKRGVNLRRSLDRRLPWHWIRGYNPAHERLAKVVPITDVTGIVQYNTKWMPSVEPIDTENLIQWDSELILETTSAIRIKGHSVELVSF